MAKRTRQGRDVTTLHAIVFTLCGAVFGYIFAHAEAHGFCTGYYNETTKICRPY